MYQPKTGQECFCKRGIERGGFFGIERDNCSNCEGTGYVIDFKTIRAKTQKKTKVAVITALNNNH